MVFEICDHLDFEKKLSVVEFICCRFERSISREFGYTLDPNNA